jgi:hypothetical protein
MLGTLEGIMTEDIQEMHEHAQEAQHDPHLAPVTLSMAILAVLVAMVSLLGHRAHTEEILLHSGATDRWAHYQAKSIRRHTASLFADLLSVAQLRDVEAGEKLRVRTAAEAARYGEEQKEIEADARRLEAEVILLRHRADRFDLGEVLLEIALVVTSITLLTRRRGFWMVGLVLAVAGILVAGFGVLLH